MNRKIADMVRLLLPVFLLAGLSVSIQAVAAAVTEVAPAGNSVVSRSNGSMTMSGLVQTGTCSLSASNATMNFKPMALKEIQAQGRGSIIGQFDTVLNISNCAGTKLIVSIQSGDYILDSSPTEAYLRYPGGAANSIVSLSYSVELFVNSGYCNKIIAEQCTTTPSSILMPLDGYQLSSVGDNYYKPDNDNYKMTLKTTLYNSKNNINSMLFAATYTGHYIYSVTYQ
ncbi:hypothetical protein LRC69_004410 [Salmonella enterica]|nr:hypothetical protein [Salmonella enterica]